MSRFFFVSMSIFLVLEVSIPPDSFPEDTPLAVGGILDSAEAGRGRVKMEGSGVNRGGGGCASAVVDAAILFRFLTSSV